MIKKLLENKLLNLLFIFSPSVLIFIRILRNNPFFQFDDFSHLEFVYTHGYWEMLPIILSKAGIWVGHHIVFGFWLFKAIFDLFGTNIIPFIAVVFLLNLTVTLGLYLLSGEYIKNNLIRALISFFFGFFYLSWISNIHELLGASFLVYGLFTFTKWVKKRDLKYGAWTIVLYVFAIFSKEITFLSFPVMLVLYWYLKNGRLRKSDLKILIPFLIIFILYCLFFASTFLGYFGLSSGYKMTFNLSTLSKNLSYYLEIIMPAISQYYLLAVLVLAGIYLTAIYKKIYLSLIFLAAFFIQILPALFFADRTAPYYAYVPSIFLFLSLGIVADSVKIKNKVMIAALLILIALFVFDIGKIVKYNLYLIVHPWPNRERDQFLSLVSDVKKSEQKNEDMAEFKLEDKSKEIILTHGVEVLKPFLPLKTAETYVYTIDNTNSVLVVAKK